MRTELYGLFASLSRAHRAFRSQLRRPQRKLLFFRGIGLVRANVDYEAPIHPPLCRLFARLLAERLKLNEKHSLIEEFHNGSGEWKKYCVSDIL